MPVLASTAGCVLKERESGTTVASVPEGVPARLCVARRPWAACLF